MTETKKKVRHKPKKGDEKSLDRRRFENLLIKSKRAESFWKILVVIVVIGALASNGLVLSMFMDKINQPQMVAILEKQIELDGREWETEAKAAKLYWSPIITKFTPHSSSDGAVIISVVEGSIIENGEFGGVVEQRTHTFKLGLRLQQNPKIGEKGRFPWVCISYNLSIK